MYSANVQTRLLPTGTITFLYTDIEGSTRHWELYPIEMQVAVSQHNALVRDAIAAHNGIVFETAGDSFVAIFQQAVDALDTALDAQVALVRFRWPESIGKLRVRMALHTGPAELRPDGYYAQHTLSRLSRLLASAHGEQVLVSQSSHDLLMYQLPDGVELVGLGEHRLRDLIAPERIYQVSAPDAPWQLPHSFPPIKTLDSRPNNLPIQLTPVIGRKAEVAAVFKMLTGDDARDGRIVTLTGPGGTGKTRVGLQVAAELIDRFDHGVCFVNLAPISDIDLVTSTIAMSLRLKEGLSESLIETVKNHLKDKRMLLLIDNFEQVAAAAPQVSELVAAAPGVKVLVTSRVPLRIRGEREFPIPPLTLPDYKRLPSLEQLTQYEAVRLFIDRATDIKPDFQVTNDNAPAVAEICVRLDGLPLAIELAAARIRLLPPQAMLSRLQNRLKLLTGGAKDVSARQQTLRGAIDWSHDLLDSGEKQLFRRLAVFVGGRTLEAIEAVCNVDSSLEVDVLDGVESLVHNNLLRQEESIGGEPRFMMLETIHEFAREKLDESVERDDMRLAHASFFVEFAEKIEPELRGPNAAQLLDQLQLEYDNLRAALEWALDGLQKGLEEQATIGLRLTAGLWRFWYGRGYWSEGSEWLATVLSKSKPDYTKARAEALYGAGMLALERGDYAKGRTLIEESVVAYKEAGDLIFSALAIGKVGDIAYAEGDYTSARLLIEEALAQTHGLGNQFYTAQLLSNLGELMRAQADYAAARELDERALAIHTAIGDTGSIALQNMYCNLGNVVLRQGDHSRAATYFTMGFKLSIKLASKVEIALSILGLAGCAGAFGAAERAVRLFGAAEHQLDELGAKLWPADRLDYEHNLATTRALLDEVTFERARAEGWAMSVEQAVAYALEDMPGS